MSGKVPRVFDAETRSDPCFPWLDLEDRFQFPDADETRGTVVAIGGNLSPGMLVSAYSQGIFPWFNDDDPLYWQSPDPRFVITGDSFHVPSRLKRTIRQGKFQFKTDTSFERVLTWCSAITRKGQDGSWITDDMLDAYLRLHQLGIAHSVETWMDGHLVGGLYGVYLGNVFFGESMFTRVTDAGKAAFVVFAHNFFNRLGGKMIDSQVYTDHVARFGGVNISRSAYLRKLSELLGEKDTNLFAHRGVWPVDLLSDSLLTEGCSTS